MVRTLLREYSIVLFPKREIRRTYKSVFSVRPDLRHPKDWVEKMYWLLLNTDTTSWSECADKHRMREFVSRKGLEFLLPNEYGCWKNANSIRFDELPESFVLKTNNATETCIVVKNKGELDVQNTRIQLNKWIKRRYGFDGCQFHYLKIPPVILAEELLIPDEIQNRISPKSLIDYKFYCCSGEPQCVWVAYNRDHISGVDMNIYDMNWNSHPEWLHDMDHYHFSSTVIPKPLHFDKMIEYCRILSSDFAEVRIDFYVISEKIYIGELTFTSGYGFFTPEFYKYLGGKVSLPPRKNNGWGLLQRIRLLKYIGL